MIELQITGECAGCPGLDPDIRKLYVDNAPCFTAICRNQRVCEMLRKRFEQGAGDKEA